MQQAQAIPGKLLKLTCAVAVSGMTLCPGGEADRSVTARVVRTSAASSGDDLDRAQATMLLRPLCICPCGATETAQQSLLRCKNIEACCALINAALGGGFAQHSLVWHKHTCQASAPLTVAWACHSITE